MMLICPDWKNEPVQESQFISFCLQPAASRKKGAKSSSEDENTPSTTRKVVDCLHSVSVRKQHAAECDRASLIINVWNVNYSCYVNTCSYFRGKLHESLQLHQKEQRRCRSASRTPPSDGWSLFFSFLFFLTPSLRLSGPINVKLTHLSGFRSTRKPLVTPARSMLDSSLMMGSTPLITPRFDPRWSISTIY